MVSNKGNYLSFFLKYLNDHLLSLGISSDTHSYSGTHIEWEHVVTANVFFIFFFYKLENMFICSFKANKHRQRNTPVGDFMQINMKFYLVLYLNGPLDSQSVSYSLSVEQLQASTLLVSTDLLQVAKMKP